MTGAGPGLEKLKMPGSEFFIAGAGPEFTFFYCQGRGRTGIIFFIAGATRDLYFFIAGSEAGPGLKILK